MEHVAPLAGAWIEIIETMETLHASEVAPLAGAWIEISLVLSCLLWSRSLPSRERGLKLSGEAVEFEVGVGRSPRGSVD